MQALTFWKTITVDHSNLLENLIELLRKHEIRFCVIGGQAVNAYAEPLVSLDLHLAIAVDQIDQIAELFEKHFVVKRFPHSLNVTIPDSDVRVQIQTDKRYASFLERASPRFILGMELPVASVEDVLRAKFGLHWIPSVEAVNVKRTWQTFLAFSKTTLNIAQRYQRKS